MKSESIWTKIELYTVGILALIGAFIGFYGIVMRYVFVQPVGWTEEVITYLLVWGLMIVISPVQKYNEHIRVDFAFDKLSTRMKNVVQIFILTLSTLFSIIVIIYGWRIVENVIKLNQVSQSSLQFPLWIVRLSIPVGFALLTLRFIQSALFTFREKKALTERNEVI